MKPNLFDILRVSFLFLCLPLVKRSQEYHPGHLKPFGLSGPYDVIDEVDGYPEPLDFFQNHVARIKPLKMKNAITDLPAFNLWTDSYFMSLETLNEVVVSVESNKVEDRQQPLLSMTFIEFLKVYNTSDNYLVTNIPDPLSPDVSLPLPLQCPEIYEDMLLTNIMWMSSGDTASVVHTDSVDNIICSLRGTKRIVLVDPLKYSKQVFMEHPEEGYSDIDVKEVNYTKYFGLLNVSYHMTNIMPGDCLFIPYEWIHQVNSFNSNIAINIWWDHNLNDKLDLTSCKPDKKQPIPLSQVTFHGISSHFSEFKAELMEYLSEEITNVDLYSIIVDESDLPFMPQNALNILDQIFEIIDTNNDGIATTDDVKLLSKKDWAIVEKYYEKFLGILEHKRTRAEKHEL